MGASGVSIIPGIEAYINDPLLTMAAGERILLSRLAGHTNKYGRAANGIQTTATDIWDRADATPTQQIWVPPTQARTHTIASDSANDTDGGTGARTVRVWGLTTWGTAESSEDVTMDTGTPPTTSSSYVIIHRMKVLTHGTAGPNAGNITATATTDGTVTAQISDSQGQTLMAILGIPSVETAYLTCYALSMHESGTPANPSTADFTMLINESPDVDELPAGFLNKSNLGVIATGSSAKDRCYKPYFKVVGPAIIKFQAIGNTADSEGVAEFDVIRITN